MKGFADRLAAAVEAKGTPLVVGLDPALAELPERLVEEAERRHGKGRRAAAAAVREFTLGILEAVADLVPAVKPQAAYFEALGAAGWEALAVTVREAHRRGLLVILDAKRGDIGATAEAYASACLSKAGLDADAVTVNPLFGWEGLAPFLAYAGEGKGAFALVRTSNPSGREVQDFGAAGGGRKFSDHLADLVSRWGAPYRGESGWSALGAVVAGTDPAEAARLRQAMPATPFLVPGYGAQGGRAADVAPCFDARGRGAVVNAARSIIFAFRRPDYRERFSPEEYAAAAREAVRAARQDLEKICNLLHNYAAGGRMNGDIEEAVER
ncbi:MAG: orotidine-5'-phosphate decarboxylase [Bacillota bacterium]|nr:orotidine-5'-phosphate decarboxylase [Bacillota bacterium]